MKNLSHGLPERTVDTLAALFRKYAGIQKVILYGSRAAGTQREASDIDISLLTDASFTHQNLIRLYGDLSDSDIPYEVDVSIYDTLNNPDLKKHIRDVGKVLFARDCTGGVESVEDIDLTDSPQILQRIV
jgi:predicted nucleotidyltransferase